MQKTIKVNKQAIVESLELMSNKEFMESYQKSKEQIKKMEFSDWEEIALQRLRDVKKDPSIGRTEKELDDYLKKRGVSFNVVRKLKNISRLQHK